MIKAKLLITLFVYRQAQLAGVDTESCSIRFNYSRSKNKKGVEVYPNIFFIGVKDNKYKFVNKNKLIIVSLII